MRVPQNLCKEKNWTPTQDCNIPKLTNNRNQKKHIHQNGPLKISNIHLVKRKDSSKIDSKEDPINRKGF
jgi:hypothetical protein